jgi:3',5'-cyclic-AMP phosphodiesterase
MDLSRVILILSSCVLFACNDLIDVTPYDTLPENARRQLNARGVELLRQQAGQSNGPLTLAFTSDPHFYYGPLADVIEDINNRPQVQGVIVPGDLTDQGLVGEFELFAARMEKSRAPWLAVIGNHDHLSNGRIIYEQMFGPRNFIMDLREYRFIFFDNTLWEAQDPPDLPWLEQALAGAGDLIPIVVAHIPVHADQLETEYGPEIRALFQQYGVPLFLHGHIHGFRYDTPFNAGTRYLSIPWPRSREYVLLTMEGTEFDVQRITL